MCISRSFNSWHREREDLACRDQMLPQNISFSEFGFSQSVFSHTVPLQLRLKAEELSGSKRPLIQDPSFHSNCEELNRSVGLWGGQTPSRVFPSKPPLELRNSISLVETNRLYWRRDHGKHFEIDVRRTSGSIPPLKSPRFSVSIQLDTAFLCSMCSFGYFIRLDCTV